METKEIRNYLISVIVPCFNQAQYLHEALDSLINQSFQCWECIIVNDGSPDNTEDVALKYCKKDSRFQYLKKENGGLSSARNSGIKIAKGELILPLDADDIIGSAYLEKAVAVFSENRDVSVVYCEAKKIGIVNENWILPKYSFKELLLNNVIFCTAFFRKEAWEYCNGYDENLKTGFEDWDFWLKILDEKSKVYKIPEVLFFYRVKEVSMLKTLINSDQDNINWQIFEKNISKYKMYYRSPVEYYLEDHIQAKLNQEILNSRSYKIGNKIVRFLNLFSLK